MPRPRAARGWACPRGPVPGTGGSRREAPRRSGQPGAPRLFRSTGRSGLRRATTRKPCRAKTEATPGNRLPVWAGTAVSNGVRLEGRGARRGRHRQGGLDQRVHDTPAAVRPPHIKARNRPHGQVIHGLQVPAVRQPAQVGPRRQLAPSHGDGPVEGEQAGRPRGCREPPEVVLVVLARPVTVARADAPVHAPASVRGTGRAEEVLERGPPPGGEGANREIHAAHVLTRW